MLPLRMERDWSNPRGAGRASDTEDDSRELIQQFKLLARTSRTNLGGDAETSDLLAQERLLRVAKEYARLAEMAERNLPDAVIGPAVTRH
jgi:hypothetical protein